MVLVAEIADLALAKVGAKVTDAIITSTLFEPTQGAYSTVTGTYAAGETNHGSMSMVVQTEKPIQDLFPDYIKGDGDQLVFLRGDVAPEEGWELRGAKTYTIRAVQDILGNGTIFNAVVR
jgi:hypothetical protein